MNSAQRRYLELSGWKCEGETWTPRGGGQPCHGDEAVEIQKELDDEDTKKLQNGTWKSTREIEAPLIFRHFSGVGATTMDDHDRLNEQHVRIKNTMKDQVWRTLYEIHELTGYPEASISAQLRHMRKLGFGGHEVNKRHRGPGRGLWEYQLILKGAEAMTEAQMLNREANRLKIKRREA